MTNRRYIRRRRNALLITALVAIVIVGIIVLLVISVNGKSKKTLATATATVFRVATTIPNINPTATPLPTDMPTIEPSSTTSPSPASTTKPASGAMYVKVTANSKLNVRASASATASIVTTLNIGETVTVLSQGSTWSNIKTASGKTGYVQNSYLVSTKPDVATEMKKLWDKTVYRDGSTTTNFSLLTATYQSDYLVKFTLAGTAGTATNTISGSATISGNVATYTKGTLKVTLTTSSGKITVAVTNSGAPAGITYNATYSSGTKPTVTTAPTPAPSTTPLYDKGLFFSATQEDAFKDLTDTNYSTFVDRAGTVSAISVTATEKLYKLTSSSSSTKTAVIMVTSDGKIYAAYSNSSGVYTTKFSTESTYPTEFTDALS